MSAAKHAIHSIRNDLTPILWFAELASTGDTEAQRLVIKELVKRAQSIHEELDVLTTAARKFLAAGL
ncbi:MAG TPA: hypothetical protein VHY22_19160 [Chthoniobacteraceae bacterium]|jgi:hypothetical protein|nr:hypothetical protein [Chthoniobacteraceae bacterium]